MKDLILREVSEIQGGLLFPIVLAAVVLILNNSERVENTTYPGVGSGNGGTGGF